MPPPSPDRTAGSFPLDVIEIKTPCSASWDAMAGDDTKRFCAQCELHVHNLAEMRRPDAEALINGAASAGGRFCVQMRRDTAGRVVTRDDRRWGTRFRRRAAYSGAKTLVGLAAFSLVVLSAAGVFASRESRWLETMARWKENRAPPPPLMPSAGVAGMVVPPPLGEPIAAPEVPPAPEQPLDMLGDVALPEPVPVPAPPAVRGRISLPTKPAPAAGDAV